MGLEQNICVAVTGGRFKAVAGQLNQQAERIFEINRIHKAAILVAAMVNAGFVEPFDGLAVGRLGDVEGNVVHAASLGWRATVISFAFLIAEDGDQSGH